MIRKMKYVIIDIGLDDIPIIFPDSISHNTMTNCLGYIAISAGFVAWSDSGIRCWGNSHSLGIKSRPQQDAEIISFKLGVKQ